MKNYPYHLKCNAPKYEQHRGYSEEYKNLAIDDFESLQRQFQAKHYPVKSYFRSNPLRGTIQVEVDGFYYYVELYKEK